MEVYGYQYMQGACNDCKKILEKMKQSIDSFDSATGVYSASIKDKISVAAEKLVEDLRDSIDRTKQTIDDMNETMGEAAEGLEDNEEQGEGDIEDI